MATKPVEIEILLKDRLSAGLDAMQRKLDALMAGATSSAERVHLLDAAIGALNVQLTALKEAGKGANPDLDQSGNIAAIEKVEAKIKELQTQLNTLNETAKGTQTVPPDAGQAVKQYNGLHMSIQQIAREMPSLAMGPQMFFLAISNNLPIFTDELARARKEYEALTASGQKATPVWRQVLSSLFSWQTALTTGIMLLVMYGDEIVDWVAGLFKGKEALSATAAEQRSLNAALGEARTSAAKEAAQLTLLYKMTQNTSASLRDRRAAVSELQSQYPAYFGNLSQEAILAGQAAGQYRQLARDIQQAAYARAYQKRIEDLAEQNVGLQRAINADTNWTRRNREEYDRRLERIRISQEAAEAAVASPTDAAVAAATASLERQGDALIAEYDRRTEALAKNKAQLEANERAMQSYEQEVLKRQKPLMQTTQGKSYVEPQTALDAGAGKADGRQQRRDEERAGRERLEARREADEALLALQRQTEQERIALMAEGSERELAEIRLDYDRRMDEIGRQEERLREENRKAGLTDTGEDGLTEAQALAVGGARLAAIRSREQAEDKLRADEARRDEEAMDDYLRRYGQYEERRLALTRQYEGRIREARTEGERLSLGRERDEALGALDLEEFKRQIDFADVFDRLEAQGTEALRRLAGQLRQYINEQASALAPSDLKDLSGALGRIEAEVAGRRPMEAVIEGLRRWRSAADEVREAQEALDEATRRGSAWVEEYDERTGQFTRRLIDRAEAERRLREAQGREGEGREQAARGMEGAAGSISRAVSDMQAIAGTLSEVFGVELGEDVEKLLAGGERMSEGLSRAAQSLLSGDVFGAVSGVVGMVGGAFEQLEGIAGLFGYEGESDPRLAADIERLTASNEALAASVDRLSEQMEAATGQTATDLRAEEQALLDKQVAQTMEMMLRSALAYDNGFLGMGGTHSSGSKVDEDLSEADFSLLDEEGWNRLAEQLGLAPGSLGSLGDILEQLGMAGLRKAEALAPNGWQAISELLGQAVGSSSDFFSLSPEQMDAVRNELPTLWARIKALADDGYRDAAQFMEDYADFAEEREQLDRQWKESLTQVSFDSLYDSFVDELMDMDAAAEDFVDGFSERLMRAILQTELDSQLRGRVEDWYDRFAASMEDGALSADERSGLEDEWQDIVEAGLALRDQLAQAVGYEGEADAGTSQTGRAGSFNAMSQEQGTKLEGLFTSGQMHWASIDEQMQDVSEQMAGAVDHLRRIEENTGSSARHLGEIKEDIRKILRDGLRVK